MSTLVLALDIEAKTCLIKETEICEDFTAINLYERSIHNSDQIQNATYENIFFQSNDALISPEPYSLKKNLVLISSYADSLSKNIWGNISQAQILQIIEDKYDPEQSVLQPYVSKVKITIYCFIGATLFILLGNSVRLTKDQH